MDFILFSTSDSLGSKLIRKAAQEPVSHVAILKDNMVWESRFPRGVRVVSFKDWAKYNQLIATEAWPEWAPALTLEELADGGGNWYDVGALLWLGLCFAVGVHPKSNQWNHPSAKICTEYVTKLLFGAADSTITPWQLRKKLQEINS